MKKLILAFALLTVIGASAQTIKTRTPTIIDLQARYDLWPSDSKLLVQDIFDLKAAKAKYPACFQAWEREKIAGGMTTAQADTWIMGMTLGEAAYFDALWTGSSWIANSGIGRGLCLSRNVIIWPVGTYYTRDQLDYAYGIVKGTSSSSNYEPTGTGGTVIKLWNANWRGTSKERIIFAAYHGQAQGSNSYSESTSFSDMRLDGSAGNWKDTAYTIIGLQAWDFGSGSEFHNLFINHCDIGLDIVRGTPFTATGNNAFFQCNVAAIALTGAAGATVTFSGTVESDDCPAVFLVRSGWGRPAGCMLNVQTIKVEWAISGARTWKPESILNGEGWIHAVFGSISQATGNVYQDALFNVKGNVNSSFIHVGDLRVFAASNVAALLHDDIAKKTWLYGVGWTSHITTFDWYSDGVSSQFTSWPSQAVSVDAPHQGRLGYLPGDPKTGKPMGAFDRIKGTPTWSDVTGTSQAPVVPPVVVPPVVVPPSTGTIAEYHEGNAMLTNAGASTSTTVIWAGATRITITGLTWSGTPSYQSLFGNAKGAIRAFPDGSIVDSRTGKVVAPKGTVTGGKAVDVVLSIDPMDITYFGAQPGTGNAWKGTIKSLLIQ